MGLQPPNADAARKVELAQVLARHGAAYLTTHRLATVQYRAMRAIQACRTEALGGHVERCDACGLLRYRYHSCRNRHCPKCQTLAKERWLAARQAELLPAPYFHVVFTLPHQVNPLAQGNPRMIYRILFDAAARTLLEFGENPRWLGGEIGVTMVLHTWGQTLNQHLHVHALVSGGALAPDGHWIHPRGGFLFPVKALSAVFRGKFLAGLKRAFDSGALALANSAAALADASHRVALFAALRAQPWVVYAKRPFAGPSQVLQYLGRYTHRIALTNSRLVSLSDTEVRFRYKDYAAGNRRKTMGLDAQEFIRRYLLHVLPKGFMRIRHYGLNGNRAKRHKLSEARAALDAHHPSASSPHRKPSKRSGCASPSSTSINARTAQVARCVESACCSHAPTARRHELGLLRTRTTAIPTLPPRVATALAHAPRIDHTAGLCHSPAHHHRPTDTDPSASCPARPAPAPRPAATRRASDLIQIPNTVALNPALQSNGFYPPCCRTADKTLFVREQRQL